MKKYWPPILFLLVLTAACRHQKKPLSFYYWKTQFALNNYERNVLQQHEVKTLYVRYFDVDFKPGDQQPVPVSPLQADTSIRHYRIIPVIFIRNRTFERLTTADIPTLARNVFALVAQINRSQGISTQQIQFDCDWTERTRVHFFQFIKQYRALGEQIISSTIRLHQVKYKDITGVPPVDYGVLMYYNMGAINGDNNNSIYEKSIAGKYNAYIKSYPLPLDVALPVFSWALTIREGKVVQLLNKINFPQFENDSNFIKVSSDRYQVKHACFKAGYYFKENDQVKKEQVPASDLIDITNQINKNSNHRIGKLIFYDLDSTNLVQYETAIFEKALDNLN
ncbi:hypothetical protein [Niastella populi]|uniref:Lipoprotein n=1 Tax=Niastella populi TaxID=550983 RepID=A0A1V9FJ83_9BACT|nr:hypothetical protein [Niastella populi]OQP58409.1 hypothetical protein A4R26_02830 [Niastella populi]